MSTVYSNVMRNKKHLIEEESDTDSENEYKKSEFFSSSIFNKYHREKNDILIDS